jgi:hypothetical protein
MEPQIAKLYQMTTAQLREEWRRVLGDEPRSCNRTWIFKRLAWALQAKEYGGLSSQAQARLEELLPFAETWMPTGKKRPGAPTADPVRAAASSPGTVLTRVYKGRTLTVLVREDGRFEFEGALYFSLTAIAKAVTGSHWNGNLFFRIKPGRNRA